jgi:hypothetical protein
MSMDVLRYEPLFSLYLDIGYDRAHKIGTVPLGWRGIYPVSGGRFEGAKLAGRVLSDGADWVMGRSDDAMEIDVRLALETHDGALIAMAYTGLICTPSAVSERMRAGEPVAYEETYIRTTPRFQTADPRYAWLNKIVAVANGYGRRGDGPTYHVFAIL